MEIVFFDSDDTFCEAAARYLELDKIEGASVVKGPLQDVDSVDCVVGGMNSFGLLKYSYDIDIVAYFGNGLQEHIQTRILEDFLGEQPVGSALLVETGHTKVPYFVHAPIMRVLLRVAYSDHVYCALYAALLEVERHNRAHPDRLIQRVACPSIGTGEGGLPPAQAARQLALAFKNITRPPTSLSWHMANNRQQEIRYGGDDGVHFPPEWA